MLIRPGAGWSDLRDSLHTMLHQQDSPPASVIVQTSGSTGTPKQVRLPGPALRASGEATAEYLGGHGQWLLALPTHHVAGLQVLARSALAGTAPVSLDPDPPFTAEAFAEAAGQLNPAGRRYASLVPTQLHRLLSDPLGTRALLTLDAVLLGGAAAEPALIRRAAGVGARVVTTYGMSETCGGCVYDGIPLRGVQVRIGADDRIHVGGPVLADGYPNDPERSAERFIEDAQGRWFVTDDRGVCRDGRLTVLGRVDDVILTGGHKVEPRDVEAALRGLPEVADALVIGVEDAEWGHRVGALIVAENDPLSTVQLRQRLAGLLPAHALPRQVAFVPGIPMLSSGKPDRAQARDLLTNNGRMDSYPY